MNIPRDFIDSLLARIDLVELINAQIPLRKKSNNNYFACCPFHTEKSASFSVSQPKQFYYCFGCGAHGNAIDFLMQQDRLSFPDAIETLARTAGMTVPHEKGTQERNDALPNLYDMTAKAAHYYYDQMSKSEQAITYLKKRGITGTIAKTFSIGFAASGWQHLYDHLAKDEMQIKHLLQTGLIIKKNEGGYYDRFRERIIFPIHDYRGRVIGFGGRVIDQGEPKYLNSPETPLFQKGHELYGLYQALQANRKLERIILVEGYLDVIALFQYDITCAVATLGTATTAHHLTRLTRYTSEIIFSFDGDRAGQSAALRALHIALPLMDDHIQIKFLFLPSNEDPDSLVRKEGKEKFMARVEQATPLSHFFFDALSTQCDMETMEGRARFATLALQQIKLVPANLFRNLLLEGLSRRSRIPLPDLIHQLGLPSPSEATLSAPKPTLALAKLPNPMRLVLSMLVKQPDLIQYLPQPFHLADVPGKVFLLELVDIIQKKPNISTGTLFEHWRGKEEAALFMDLASIEQTLPQTGLKPEFEGAVNMLLFFDQENVIKALLAKAANEGLTNAEKIALTNKIQDKKLLINKQT
ncbi:MAG: DNA primase [Gammaproteobacteria bacterium]|nr:DNA primase [Gammaproteobacteria bacterium]